MEEMEDCLGVLKESGRDLELQDCCKRLEPVPRHWTDVTGKRLT
jgi:hypothetical protein